MKYVCLVYGEEQVMRTVNDSECFANGEALRRSGHYVAAEALQPATTAATVRVRDGKTVVTDGPFAEAKEMIAGFYFAIDGFCANSRTTRTFCRPKSATPSVSSSRTTRSALYSVNSSFVSKTTAPPIGCVFVASRWKR